MTALPAIVVLGGGLVPEATAVVEQAGYRIVATAPYPSDAEIAALLQTHRPQAIIVRLIRHLSGALMDHAAELKLIAKHGAGCDDIDLVAARERGIPVVAAVGANATSVAEHALMMMLALAKDVRNRDAALRRGLWDKADYAGFDLAGRTLGLIGLGSAARALARMALGIGMCVIAHDPYAPPLPGVQDIPDAGSLFAAADVVSLHCPSTAETRNLVDAGMLARMKPSAILINTARGDVVDEAALFAALSTGRIAGAGLDCFAEEPPGADHPFWRLPNVIVTPHTAGVTRDARQAVSLMTARNVVAFLQNDVVPPHLFRAPVGG